MLFLSLSQKSEPIQNRVFAVSPFACQLKKCNPNLAKKVAFQATRKHINISLLIPAWMKRKVKHSCSRRNEFCFEAKLIFCTVYSVQVYSEHTVDPIHLT